MFSFLLIAAGLLFATLRLCCGSCVMGRADYRFDTTSHPVRIPVIALGWALSLFLVVSYLLCVGFDLTFPQYAMYEGWIALTPGFSWLSVSSFVIGLAWAFIYGWYGALLFGGIFNAIAAQT